MKTAFLLFAILLTFQAYRADKLHKDRQANFEQCSDGSDYSCEVCDILLDGKERTLIKASESDEGISVVFAEGADTFALEGLNENEYFTLVKHSK